MNLVDPVKHAPILTPHSAPPGARPQSPSAQAPPADRVTLEGGLGEAPPDPPKFSIPKLILGALAVVPLLGLAAYTAIHGTQAPPPPPSSISAPVETPTSSVPDPVIPGPVTPGPVTPAPETPAPARIGVLMPVPVEGEGARMEVPDGVSQIVFEKGSVRAQDAQGNDVVVQPDWAGQVWTTVLSAPGENQGLLFEGQNGEMVLKLPAGTKTVMIFPAQVGNDGTICAVDAKGDVIGAHHNSDIQLLSKDADTWGLARHEPFMTESKDGSVTLDLPAGTREVWAFGSQVGNDGTLVAVDAYGRALQFHHNWGDHWSTLGQDPSADPAAGRLVAGNEGEQVSLKVVPGTRRVELRPGASGMEIRELDASGNVLAHQQDAPLKVVPGGI